MEQVSQWLRLFLIVIAGRALLTWVNEVSANAVAVRIKTDLRADGLKVRPVVDRRWKEFDVVDEPAPGNKVVIVRFEVELDLHLFSREL